MYTLGVDIGGTKIAAGLIDESGNCFSRVELPSIKTDREQMFQQVVRSIEEVLNDSQLSIHELKGIGIGVPGKVDTEKGIAVFQNNLPWRNFPLTQRIKEFFSVSSVIMDNDVFMAAFAEWKIRGSGQQETFVYFTVSTGISCCTIHNGNFIRGAGFAGEIGFLPVRYDSSTGQYEGLESVVSGPGIARMANKRKNHSKGYESAVIVTTKQVLEDYKIQQPYATAVMKDVSEYLSRGLYAVSCLLDPNKLVLGGGVINHHPDLLDSVKASLKKYLVPDQMDLLNRMDVSELKGNAGLVGAGLRAWRNRLS